MHILQRKGGSANAALVPAHPAVAVSVVSHLSSPVSTESRGVCFAQSSRLMLGVLLCLCLAAASPHTAAGQRQGGGQTQHGAPDGGPASYARFLRWSYADAGALLESAGRQAPLILGSTGVLAAASRLDPTLLEGVQESDEGPAAPFLDATNRLGDASIPLLSAGLFGVSLATNDRKFQDAAFTSLQSLVYARLLTNTLKGVVGRSRPEAGAGARRLDPFSGSMSFPSGHTTTAFALVTPWVLYYPHPVTYGLFALSTGTAVARIAHNRHWPTDVMAGAAIGFFVARYLTHLHQQRSASFEAVSVVPAVGSHAIGIGLRFQFE